MQKRDKSWLIWLLCAMGRRQKDSKILSTRVVRHKALGSWEGMGQREVGGLPYTMEESRARAVFSQ